MSEQTPQSAISLHTRYARHPRIADQELSGKAVILDFEGRRMRGLNECGTRIWSLLDGDKTVGTICEALAREFDTTVEELQDDVTQFLSVLAGNDLIVARGDEGSRGDDALASEVTHEEERSGPS